MNLSSVTELLCNKLPIVPESVSRYTYWQEVQRSFFEPGFCIAQVYSRFLSPINRALMEYENVSFWR